MKHFYVETTPCLAAHYRNCIYVWARDARHAARRVCAMAFSIGCKLTICREVGSSPVASRMTVANLTPTTPNFENTVEAFLMRD